MADDLGIRAWVERVAEDLWPPEFVTSSDISRILRLLEVTASPVVLVEVDEGSPERSRTLIEAIVRSFPGLTVVAVATRIGQDDLLSLMRAGVRDCFNVSNPIGDVRERLQGCFQAASGSRPLGAAGLERKLILVGGAAGIVDTRFFTQSMAVALSGKYPSQRILAIDGQSQGGEVFCMDANNRLTLETMLVNPASLDESMVSTGLEQFGDNLCLLAGNLGESDAHVDRNADLFIAISRLADMFDHIIVNTDARAGYRWVRTLGSRVRYFVMLMHPLVGQAHAAREALGQWRPMLPDNCEVCFVVDGYEKKVPPGLSELQEVLGTPLLGTLPLDWRTRLLAMNAGLPVQTVAPKSDYAKHMDGLVLQMPLMTDQRGSSDLKQWLRFG
ncbi:MAG: hypothetical protein LAT63_07320 [Marinobacter sp.]|nr:hypothetical protein [Marinobacter sp.]